MDRLDYYRQCVQQILIEQLAKNPNNSDIESQLIFDKDRDRYLWLDVGWQELNRVYACFIHLDIKEGQIWIQRNLTEVDIAEMLVNLGVSKEDIVLGLQPPYKRPYTGYGTEALKASRLMVK
jgi:hypothetical protein